MISKDDRIRELEQEVENWKSVALATHPQINKMDMAALLRRSDLSYAGDLFGYRRLPGDRRDLPIVEIYTHDDENWYRRVEIDQSWVADLLRMVEALWQEIKDDPKARKAYETK